MKQHEEIKLTPEEIAASDRALDRLRALGVIGQRAAPTRETRAKSTPPITAGLHEAHCLWSQNRRGFKCACGWPDRRGRPEQPADDERAVLQERELREELRRADGPKQPERKRR